MEITDADCFDRENKIFHGLGHFFEKKYLMILEFLTIKLRFFGKKRKWVGTVFEKNFYTAPAVQYIDNSQVRVEQFLKKNS